MTGDAKRNSDAVLTDLAKEINEHDKSRRACVVIRGALQRDEDGKAITPVGMALDALAEREDAP